MEGVEFEEQTGYSRPSSNGSYDSNERKSFFFKLFEKIGVVDKTTVNLILLALMAIFFGITIFLYAGILAGNKYDPVLEAQAIQKMNISH